MKLKTTAKHRVLVRAPADIMQQFYNAAAASGLGPIVWCKMVLTCAAGVGPKVPPRGPLVAGVQSPANDRVTLNCSAEQHELWETHAHRAGLQLATWARLMLLLASTEDPTIAENLQAQVSRAHAQNRTL